MYLHNNKLADAGLPDNMFNGSSNVEILILSSNFLRHVPKHLPPALYKLHLKVGGRVWGGAAEKQGPAVREEPRSTEAQWGGCGASGTVSAVENKAEAWGAGCPYHMQGAPSHSPFPWLPCPLSFRGSALAPWPSLMLPSQPSCPSEQQAGEDPTRRLQ